MLRTAFANRHRYPTILDSKRHGLRRIAGELDGSCRLIYHRPSWLTEDSAISSLTARTATQQDDMMAREGGHYAAYRLVARSLRKHSPRPPAPPTNYPCVLTMFLNKFYNLES